MISIHYIWLELLGTIFEVLAFHEGTTATQELRLKLNQHFLSDI